MDLVLSVAAFCAACLLATVVLLAVNRPHTPFWASDGMVSNVWLLLLVGLVAFGAAFGLRFVFTLSSQSLGFSTLASVIAIVAVTAGAILLLSPRRRLLVYAAAKAAPGVDGGQDGPATPEQEGGGHPPRTPRLPRAA